MSPQEKQHRVRDIGVRLLRAGTGRPLLFLHGATGMPPWNAFFEKLALHYDVLVPEHAGFGTPENTTQIKNIADLAMYYLDFLDDLNAGAVHLVGQSLGGWTAAEIAVRNGSQLASLCLIRPAGIRVKGIPSGDNFIWSPEETARNLFHDQSFAEPMLSAINSSQTVAIKERFSRKLSPLSCPISKLKSSGVPIKPRALWCFHAVGSSNEPLLGSTAVEGWPRTGRTSTARRSLSCAWHQSASCSESFVIPPESSGQTLRGGSSQASCAASAQNIMRVASIRRFPTSAIKRHTTSSSRRGRDRVRSHLKASTTIAATSVFGHDLIRHRIPRSGFRLKVRPKRFAGLQRHSGNIRSS